jgi:hypothetical protein
MKPWTLYPIVILLSLGLLVGQVGCVHHRPIVDSPAPEEIKLDLAPEEIKLDLDLGSVGIASATFQPESAFLKPDGKGKSAAVGAGAGALAGGGLVGGVVGMVALSQPWTIIFLAYPPVLAGVGAAIGAGAVIGGVLGGISGSTKGEPSEKIRESETALHGVLAELNAQELMEAHLLTVAREKVNRDLIVFEKQGPAVLDQEVSYASLTGKGIDSILEITVRKYGLWGEKGINPLLSFFMTVSTRLIRVKDDVVLYSRTFRYEGNSAKYVDWGANNAQPFREEVDRCCRSLSEQIVESLLLPSNRLNRVSSLEN